MQVEQYEGAIGADLSQRVTAIRLLIGLGQGALLYFLYSATRDGDWLSKLPYLLTPLFMLALMLPVVLISSLGHLTPARTALWALLVAVILALLAAHDVWLGASVAGIAPLAHQAGNQLPSPLLLVFGAVFLYIAHALVMAGNQDQRLIASYGSYFEQAWKLAIQLIFSLFFVGALWAVLIMGAGLFTMVKLNFFKRLLEHAWFVIPVLCAAWSWAMHITDVRPAIVRGIRTLLLVLSSWLLPVATLIISAFLCSLPFTGLDVLWGTRQATALLLVASAVLIVLINAAFQNGQAKASLVIRISARTAAILILPLTAIAVYALGLRVREYGWSADRVIAAACVLVALCYAAGYQWAAHRYEDWLCFISRVNVATAFVVLAVLLALFTPLADPARLAVNSQLARLQKGKVTAEKFDVDYLRFDGRRYGQEALLQLARQGLGDEPAKVSALAAAALTRTSRWQHGTGATATATTIAANVTVWPAGQQLPAGFAAQKWSQATSTSASAPPMADLRLPPCLVFAEQKCDAILMDADGDGKTEVLVMSPGVLPAPLFAEGPAGRWSQVAHLSYGCKSMREQIKEGRFTLAPPRFKDLEVAGSRLQLEPDLAAADCK